MDKNKWIEEKVKEFKSKWSVASSPWEASELGFIESFLRQSLDEAWEKGLDSFDNDTFVDMPPNSTQKVKLVQSK